MKALSKFPVVMKVREVGEFPDPASMYMWWPVFLPQMMGTGAPPVTTNLGRRSAERRVGGCTVLY